MHSNLKQFHNDDFDFDFFFCKFKAFSVIFLQILILTEVAGEGGTDCPPQKFLSSQKFRHLMG